MTFMSILVHHDDVCEYRCMICSRIARPLRANGRVLAELRYRRYVRVCFQQEIDSIRFDSVYTQTIELFRTQCVKRIVNYAESWSVVCVSRAVSCVISGVHLGEGFDPVQIGKLICWCNLTPSRGATEYQTRKLNSLSSGMVLFIFVYLMARWYGRQFPFRRKDVKQVVSSNISVKMLSCGIGDYIRDAVQSDHSASFYYFYLFISRVCRETV